MTKDNNVGLAINGAAFLGISDPVKMQALFEAAINRIENLMVDVGAAPTQPPAYKILQYYRSAAPVERPPTPVSTSRGRGTPILARRWSSTDCKRRRVHFRHGNCMQRS
jgi:hypothetical protein